jgi:hypothetical protein
MGLTLRLSCCLMPALGPLAAGATVQAVFAFTAVADHQNP